MRSTPSLNTQRLGGHLAALRRHHPDQDDSELLGQLRYSMALDMADAILGLEPPLSAAQRAEVAAFLVAGKRLQR